jgi:hypothetical protein
MAVRIPVVVSQHERRSGTFADYEEKLVTRLIFENGLDATLVSDLRSIAHDTTDHLCIEGLKGDFALATWESPEYVCQHLHRLGFPAIELLPVDGSPKRTSNQDGSRPKTIFLVSLSVSASIDQTIKILKELREARSTPVFSIGSTPKRTPNVVSHVSPLPKNPQDSTVASESVSVPLAALVVHDQDDFPNIDQLMNDLDQFEL